MRNNKIYNYIDRFISENQANGKLSFSLREVQKKFDTHSFDAIKLSLNRYSRNNRIQSVFKGFYVIIPPKYSQQRILPPELFIDALMKYLERPYYVGLLTAAAYHGASHQKAQEQFVFINKPPIRSTNVKGLKINYIVKSIMPSFGLEKKKTDAGYLNISSPELTAFDLVEFQNRIGGLNRASTVLYELSESMNPDRLEKVLIEKVPFSVLQRLGYILDVVIDKKNLSNVIKEYLSDKKLFRVPLKANLKKAGYPVHKEWKIIENFKVEMDI